jgi:dienelactone hydrolase
MAFRRSAVLSVLLAITATASVAAGTSDATASPVTGRGAHAAGAATSVPTTGFRFVDITAGDGVVLKANVIAPTAAGGHPAIVFVNSWGLGDTEYLAQAKVLAGRGYVVLSYTTRGFWGSGGQIDTAGPKDMADVSTVLDWLIANTAADPAHIGVGGASYGSGISLLASAFDPRIRAVVAMSTWTDLAASLYGDNTRRPQALLLLKVAAQIFGRPSPELTAMTDAYFANQDLGPITDWGRVRSAATYIDAINRNHPAIMIANSYGDSLFPPNQLIDFYGKLTGPKRLELAPGDHVVAEGTGLLGLPNHVWDSAYRWFDRYLAGADTSIDTEPPVVLRHIDSDVAEGYDNWADVTGSTRRYNLGDRRWSDGTGPMSTGAVGGNWSTTIWTGTDTTAGAGVALLTNGFTALTGIPPMVWLPTVNRLNAAVWTSDPVSGGAAIRGMPKLHLGIASQQPKGTVIAYLYDTDGTGTGRLITHAPITWLQPTDTLDLTFQATAYDLPAGHRLALVIDTVDPLYLGANQYGTRLAFTGPSWFDVPLR